MLCSRLDGSSAAHVIRHIAMFALSTKIGQQQFQECTNIDKRPLRSSVRTHPSILSRVSPRFCLCVRVSLCKWIEYRKSTCVLFGFIEIGFRQYRCRFFSAFGRLYDDTLYKIPLCVLFPLSLQAFAFFSSIRPGTYVKIIKIEKKKKKPTTDVISFWEAYGLPKTSIHRRATPRDERSSFCFGIFSPPSLPPFTCRLVHFFFLYIFPTSFDISIRAREYIDVNNKKLESMACRWFDKLCTSPPSASSCRADSVINSDPRILKCRSDAQHN